MNTERPEYKLIETRLLRHSLDPALFVAFRLGAYDAQIAEAREKIRREMELRTSFGLLYGDPRFGPFAVAPGKGQP